MLGKNAVHSQYHAAISFIMIIMYLSLCTEVFSIKPDKTYIKTPKDIGLEYESVRIKTKDGYGLQGWLMPAKGNDIKGTIIYSGGDAGNMSYAIDPFRIFVYHGYNVMAYDYRGFGQSDDFHIDRDMLICPEFLNDLNAVIDYVKSGNEKNVVLFGFSMGAAVSLGVAGQRNDISAVIADGAYTTLDEVITNINQSLLKEKNERRFKIPDNYPANALPVIAVTHFDSTALYIIAGSKDTSVTPKMAVSLYDKCHSSEKSLWIAAGAEHGNTAWLYGKSYFDNVLAFLNQVSD